jgi:hypothetical protein
VAFCPFYVLLVVVVDCFVQKGCLMLFFKTNHNRFGFLEAVILMNFEVLVLAVETVYSVEQFDLELNDPTMALSSLLDPSTYRICAFVIIIELARA